jgi:hypothetical protein
MCCIITKRQVDNSHFITKGQVDNFTKGQVDNSAFLNADMKATCQVRRINFTLWNRMVFIPVEIVMWSKYAIFAVACLLLSAGLNQKGYSISPAMNDGLVNAILLLVSFLANTTEISIII